MQQSHGSRAGNDLTDKLAHASRGETVYLRSGTWTISRDIKIRCRLRFAGGLLRPKRGVTIEFESALAEAPETQLFDVSDLHWRRGLKRRKNIPQSTWLWSVEGGIKIPGTVYASWFGADSRPGVDNSKPLQVMLESEAHDAVLDGFYDHVANWVGDGQTLRGEAPFGGDRRYGLRTLPEPGSFGDRLLNRDPRSPSDGAFRGLSTQSGIDSVVFRDFEYDGSARESADHQGGYRSYFSRERSDEKPKFRRFRLRQNGINIGMEGGKTNYVSPGRTLVERVYIHNTVRSSIVANEAPNLVIRDCRFANSDTDHLVYADRNPDLLVERTQFSGYANDGMLVISAGTVRNCSFRNLAPNPIPGLDTNFLISIRNDIEAPSEFDSLSIVGNLAFLRKTAGGSSLFRMAGNRRATIRALNVQHSHGSDAEVAVFGTEFSATNIEIYDLKAESMPTSALLWKTDMTIRNLTMRNIVWHTAEAESPDALMQFGSVRNFDRSGFTVRGGKFGSLLKTSRPKASTLIR